MITLTKSAYAEDVEPGDELDFSMDELCYNDDADAAYARVERKTDWWDGTTGAPWCTLYTDQGEYDVPAEHRVSRKVQE
jgi:hypothetical protein